MISRPFIETKAMIFGVIDRTRRHVFIDTIPETESLYVYWKPHSVVPNRGSFMALIDQ
jgi:hypothetical protein